MDKINDNFEQVLKEFKEKYINEHGEKAYYKEIANRCKLIQSCFEEIEDPNSSMEDFHLVFNRGMEQRLDAMLDESDEELKLQTLTEIMFNEISFDILKSVKKR